MFEFNAKTHTYTLDGKRMTGVTTVLGVIAKPALIGWAANQAVDYIKERIFEVDIDTLANKVLPEARKAHIKKRDKAADAGTDVHAIIEEWVKKSMKDLMTIPSDNKQVQHFMKWAVKNKVKFLESEKQVYSKTHFTAGTYDFKCEIDGKTYIGDIKTTSGIYDRTPFAQMAAYEMMEKEMKPKTKIDGRIIVNLKKTGIFDEDKDVYISEHYEDDLELFMSALSIYRIQKNRFEPINNYTNNRK